MTPFTSFFDSSECSAVIFSISSDFVISFGHFIFLFKKRIGLEHDICRIWIESLPLGAIFTALFSEISQGVRCCAPAFDPKRIKLTQPKRNRPRHER